MSHVSLGVAYAATLGDLSLDKMKSELTSFTAAAAMGSNVCFALRSILRKNMTADFKKRTHLDPQVGAIELTFLSLLHISSLSLSSLIHVLSHPI